MRDVVSHSCKKMFVALKLANFFASNINNFWLNFDLCFMCDVTADAEDQQDGCLRQKRQRDRRATNFAQRGGVVDDRAVQVDQLQLNSDVLPPLDARGQHARDARYF